MLLAAALTAVSVLPLLVSRDVRTQPTPDRWLARVVGAPEPQQDIAPERGAALLPCENDRQV